MLTIRKGDKGREAKQKEVDSKLHLVEEASEEDTRIELLIRERYSMSMELALHRKKAMGTVDAAEWDAYCEYVQECVDRIKERGE